MVHLLSCSLAKCPPHLLMFHFLASSTPACCRIQVLCFRSWSAVPSIIRSMHFPTRHRQCIHLSGDQCPCHAAIMSLQGWHTHWEPSSCSSCLPSGHVTRHVIINPPFSSHCSSLYTLRTPWWNCYRTATASELLSSRRNVTGGRFSNRYQSGQSQTPY